MTIKMFLSKLNDLAKYALRVASTNMGEMKTFFSRFRLDIAKDVMM